MEAEVICFRPGPDLMMEIMAECNLLGITKTEYVLRKIFAAMNNEKEMQRISRKIGRVILSLNASDSPNRAIELLEELRHSIEKELMSRH
jgi:hypothetical protein